MSNCIWRIHEFDRRDNAVNVLEYVDKDSGINCKLNTWFNNNHNIFDKNDTYTCKEVRSFMKFPDLASKNFDIKLKGIFDKYEGTDKWEEKKIFKFQNNMNIDPDYDDSSLSFDDIQAITILIESYEDGDNLNNRCVSSGYVDSDERSLCYKMNADNNEKERFSTFIKTKTSEVITIKSVRQNTIELLNKLNNKRLFDIYQENSIAGYTYDQNYDSDNEEQKKELTEKLKKTREAYRSKDHILPEEIQIYLDDNVDINKGIEFNIKDLQGNNLYPNQYNSLLTQIQRNHKFRQCIDGKLGIKKLQHYKEFMDAVKNENFDISNPVYIKFIKDACNKFISLHPDDIKYCISELNLSEDKIEVLKTKICDGDISFTMMETITLVFEFIGIHIDIKKLNRPSIEILTKYSKEVLYKVITTSEYFEELNCNGRASQITKNLKTMYDKLFNPRNCTKNSLSPNIKWDWFGHFNNNVFTKVILLIFIGFIFAKIVELFSGKGCCPQVPVNK